MFVYFEGKWISHIGRILCRKRRCINSMVPAKIDRCFFQSMPGRLVWLMISSRKKRLEHTWTWTQCFDIQKLTDVMDSWGILDEFHVLSDGKPSLAASVPSNDRNNRQPKKSLSYHYVYIHRYSYHVCWWRAKESASIPDRSSWMVRKTIGSWYQVTSCSEERCVANCWEKRQRMSLGHICGSSFRA